MNEIIEKILKIEEKEINLVGNRNLVINKILKVLEEEWNDDNKEDKD